MNRGMKGVVISCIALVTFPAGSALAAPADGLYSGPTAQGGKSSMIVRVSNGQVTAIQTRLTLSCLATGENIFVDLGGKQGQVQSGVTAKALEDARDGDFVFHQAQARNQVLTAAGVARGNSFRGYIVATAAGPDPSAKTGLTLCGLNNRVNYTATLRR